MIRKTSSITPSNNSSGKRKAGAKKQASLPKGIRQLPNGKFIADVTINGVRRTATRDSLEDAIIAHQELKQKAPSLNIDASRWTLEQAFERTYALCWADKPWGYQVNKIYRSDLTVFFDKHCYLDSITTDKLDAFVVYLTNRGNTNSTINRKLAVISKMLTIAQERNKIQSFPKIPRRKEAKHRIRFLSPEEETTMYRLLMQMGYKEHADAMLVLLYTGFRLSECWRLEGRDVDLDKGTITAWKTKNGHPRTIPIVEKIRPIIEQHISLYGNGLLFPGFSNRKFESGWNRAKALAGLAGDKQFIPHALRHTCASRLAQAGVGMVIIKEWMGHQNIMTTARYTHLSPKSLEDAAKVLLL